MAEIRTKLDAVTGFGSNFIAGLSGLGFGSAFQSDRIVNSNNRPAALTYFQLKGAASGVTAGSVAEIYLLRGDGTIRDDNFQVSATSITIKNAPMLGALLFDGGGSQTVRGTFDTAALGPLGSEWCVAVKNKSGATFDAADAAFATNYRLYLPEIV